MGMITNHSYLDNPTFRGMRQSLMDTFDEIYILDLHGNSLKKETCPDGSIDQNVFDIRQGVAVAIFIKNKIPGETSVYHADLFGKRDLKYNWLESHSVQDGGYKTLKPKSPYYFFIKRDVEGIQHYLDWISIKEIFPINNVGVVTARDRFAIDMDENSLRNKIRQFHDLRVDDDLIKQGFKLKDTTTFKLKEFRKEFAKTKWQNVIKPISYRLFDSRFIAYSKWIVERPIYDTLRHMLEGENLGLVSTRQVKTGESWQHGFITNSLIESCYVSNRTSEIGYIFPLYSFPNNEEPIDLFEAVQTEKQPNIAPEILEELKTNFGRTPAPENILYYIYGVLYSNEYRGKYAEFLKIDFPRIPFTKDKDMFNAVAKLGQKIADLHLLKSTTLNRPVSKYEGFGTNDTIEKPNYNEDEERLYINGEKYFSNVKPEVWNYHIGGYQVLAKYLKDRKGRQMDDPRHYCKVVTALEKTIEFQTELDALYSTLEKSL